MDLNCCGVEGGEAEALDAGQDGVGGFGPDEGSGMSVDALDVGADGGFQRARRAVHAAPELLVGEVGEEPFDLVDPGRRGRGEVHVPARPLGEPPLDRRGLVGRHVVHDDVDVLILGHVGLDGVQEGAELAGAVACEAASDDPAGGGIQGGEQGERAVAGIVVAPPLGLSRSHRQQGLGAVERLDLRLFVDTQHERPLGRVEVEPDDIADLLDEQGVGRQLEGLAAVRLQPERPPDAMDRRGRVADGRRHRAQRPVGGVGGRRLQGQTDHLGDRIVADPPRRAGTGLVVQPVEALLGEPATPLADRVLVRTQSLRNRLVRHAVRRGEDDARPPRQPLRRPPPPRQAFELGPLRHRQLDRDRRLAHGSCPLRSSMILQTSRSGH